MKPIVYKTGRKTDYAWAISMGVYISLLIILLAMSGCGPTELLPPATQATGTSIDRAHTHVDSAESTNQRIKPHADKTGQELVNVVSDEHKAADAALAQAAKDNAAAQKQIAAQAKQIASGAAALAKVKSGWGYRLQILVQAFLTLVIVLVSLHFLAGGLSIVALMFPALAVAAPVLKIISTVCNPFAWFTFLVDHVHLAACTKAASTVKVIQV